MTFRFPAYILEKAGANGIKEHHAPASPDEAELFNTVVEGHQLRDLLRAHLSCIEFFKSNTISTLSQTNWMDLIISIHQHAATSLMALSTSANNEKAGELRGLDILVPYAFSDDRYVRLEDFNQVSSMHLVKDQFGETAQTQYKEFINILEGKIQDKTNGQSLREISIHALVKELKDHSGYKIFMKLYNFCSEPPNIRSDMDKFTHELFSRINSIQSPEDAKPVAAYAHCQLVQIHPFANGNGRTARLLMNCILIAFKMPPINFNLAGQDVGYAQTCFSQNYDLAQFITQMNKATIHHNKSISELNQRTLEPEMISTVELRSPSGQIAVLTDRKFVLLRPDRNINDYLKIMEEIEKKIIPIDGQDIAEEMIATMFCTVKLGAKDFESKAKEFLTEQKHLVAGYYFFCASVCYQSENKPAEAKSCEILSMHHRNISCEEEGHNSEEIVKPRKVGTNANRLDNLATPLLQPYVAGASASNEHSSASSEPSYTYTVTIFTKPRALPAPPRILSKILRSLRCA